MMAQNGPTVPLEPGQKTNFKNKSCFSVPKKPLGLAMACFRVDRIGTKTRPWRQLFKHYCQTLAGIATSAGIAPRPRREAVTRPLPLLPDGLSGKA